jgi:hypothetical protein
MIVSGVAAVIVINNMHLPRSPKPVARVWGQRQLPGPKLNAAPPDSRRYTASKRSKNSR